MSVRFHFQTPCSIQRILLLPSFLCSTRSNLYVSTSNTFRRRLHVAPSPTLKVSAMAKREGSFRGEKVETASDEDLTFEGPLKIVEYPDPLLRKKNKRIVTFDENLKRLVDEMFDVMYKTDGLGLSAPQVGVNVRLMVFNPAGVRGEGEEVVLVNPKIFKFSKKSVLFDEGCLSFPNIYGDVEVIFT